MKKLSSIHIQDSVDRVPGTSFKGQSSKAKQAFKAEADINSIMKKYRKTGMLVDPSIQGRRKPMFGDFTGIGDFQAVQDKLRLAHDSFMALPVDVRTSFRNDPALFVDFIVKPENEDMAIKMGLLPEKEPVATTSTPVEGATPTPPGGAQEGQPSA